MTTRKPEKDHTADRLGRPFKLEKGETFQPLRSRYGLTDRVAFEGVVRALFADPRRRADLCAAFRPRLGHDGLMGMLAAQLAENRVISREAAVIYLDERVPALLARTEQAALTTNGKTARDKSRAVRRRTVKSLKPYRR